MNFGLRTKYPEIDFEEVSLTNLVLIGGGCGDSGGGTWVQSVQTAAQSAAATPGANGSVSANVGAGAGGSVSIGFSYGSAQGGAVSGTASVAASTGHVTVTATPGGNFWVSVSGFFSWLYGSH
jgi:hypothetical protein